MSRLTDAIDREAAVMTFDRPVLVVAGDDRVAHFAFDAAGAAGDGC